MCAVRNNMEHKRGWHGRGYLPHFDGEVIQFVTFRLFDALPAGILKALRIEFGGEEVGAIL